MSDDREILRRPSPVRAKKAGASDVSSPKILRLPVPDRSDVERDRDLFAAIAATDPGVIRTVGLLVSELADVDLPPELLRGLGGHLHRLGDTLSMRADRITVDGN